MPAGLDAEALVESLLDREIPVEDLASAEAAIESNTTARAKLDSYRKMLDSLRTPIETPDLTETILQEVGRRRRWLAPSWQRVVTSGRLALAASLLAACAVVLVVQRANPEAAIFADRATPLTDVVRSSTTEASAGLLSVGSVLPSLPKLETTNMPVRQMGTARLYRLDQAMPLYQIQIGQQSKIIRLDTESLDGRSIRFEFRSGSCRWKVGADSEEAELDRWSMLRVPH
jgi:hypothetical protein